MAADAIEEKSFLPRPSAGEVLQVRAESGRLYSLGFDSSIAELTMDEGNLRISFEDGGMILLQDFHRIADSSELTLELADGDQVLGADIVEMLQDSYLDIQTDVAGAPPISDAPLFVADAGAVDDAPLLAADAGEAALPMPLSSGDIPVCGERCPADEAEGGTVSLGGPMPHLSGVRSFPEDSSGGSLGEVAAVHSRDVLALDDVLDPFGEETLAPPAARSAFTALVDTATAETIVSGGIHDEGAENEAALLSFWVGGVY